MITKITRDILQSRMRSGIATVSFYRRGLVVLSKLAIRRLDLGGGVDVYQGEKANEFYISLGDTFKIRGNGHGGAMFNCRSLAGMVIEKNWSVMPHVNISEVPPSHLTFILCNLPVDDKENSHVYALIRKKP